MCLSTLLSAVPAQACLVQPASPTPQGPVVIYNDADFTTNPAVDGGSGTALDPYRIEHLTIKVEGSWGVYISGTNAYFVLRNITVFDKAAPASPYSSCCRAGIELSSARNGSIIGATVRGTQQGIALAYVRDVTVADSQIEGSRQGLVIRDSTRVTLRGNRITNSTLTLEATTPEQAGSHVIAEDNQINGLPVFYRGNCAGVSAADRALGAVIIGNCSSISLQNLTIGQPLNSVSLLHTTGASLNDLRGGMFYFWRANQTSVRRSEFAILGANNFSDLALEANHSPPDNSTQVWTQDGSGLRIEGNDFRGGGRKIIQLGGYFASGWCSCMGPPPPVWVTGAVVTGNTLHDSEGSAIEIVDAPGAVITGNQILNVSEGVHGLYRQRSVIEENHIVGNGDYGPGISTGGEGASVSNNSIEAFDVGIQAIGTGEVRVAGNEITSRLSGIQISNTGHFSISNNTLWGGSVYDNGVAEWSPQDPDLTPDNTVNGLPIAFHHRCSDLTYDGAVLGELIVVDCQNVTVANLHFKGVSHPLLLANVQNFSVDDLSIDNASMGIALRSVYMGRVAHLRMNNTGGVAVGDAMNISFESNALTNGTAGFHITTAAGLEFLNNRVESGGEPPMTLYQTFELTLRHNVFEGGGLAFYGNTADEFASHDIDESNMVDGQPLVYLRDREGATVAGRTVGELILANCTGVEVRNVTARSGGATLVLAFLSGARLTNVTATSRTASALSGVQVEGLEILDSAFSLVATDPPESTGPAVALTNVQNVTLRDVTVNGTGYTGLDIEGGLGVTLQGGSFGGGRYGADMRSLTGVSVEGASFFGTYGGLSARSLLNARIADSHFGGSGGGLSLESVRATEVLRNTFEDSNYTGLSLSDSTDVRVAGNTLRHSNIGISLYGSLQNVSADGNTVVGNHDGLYLDIRGEADPPVDLRVFNNTIEGNAIGVRGNASAGVQVYHNRFLNNTIQARVSPGALWDAGYLVGGNFWSDYRGKDACSGPNQDVCPDPDEFGDTPYCLGAPHGTTEAVDRYPLMNQTPPPPRDPPPSVAPPTPPPVPGAMDPTAAGLSGLALVLGVVATAALLAAHARARRRDEAKDEEADPEGPLV